MHLLFESRYWAAAAQDGHYACAGWIIEQFPEKAKEVRAIWKVTDSIKLIDNDNLCADAPVLRGFTRRLCCRGESVRRSESLCKGEFRVSLGPIYPKLGVHTRMRLAAALAIWDGATGALIFRRPKCKFRTGGWRDA